MTTITALTALDLRAPTSRTLAGSDAVHGDPDYSAAYCTLHTDTARVGHGMTFTIGRGNDIVCHAIDALAHHVVGCNLADLVGDFASFHRRITNDSQLRWLGPDKGVIHLATAAIVNAVWDLWAKTESKPVWKLVADLTPEQFVGVIDFRYLSDALTAAEALAMLRALEPTKAQREAELLRDGYPAYITSAGWIGYSEPRVRELIAAARDDGWTAFKTKVGIDIPSDVRRVELTRALAGDGALLMADANQVWDVPQAIDWMPHLAHANLRWIEEPTSPDDVLGHAAIRRALAPMGVATGEHCANKVMFKQLLQADAIDYLQVDACRLGGLNEVLAVLLLAAKFEVAVCPHAGGIGLCEYVQHISAIDYLCVSGSLVDRTTEYADHCHEYFVHPAVVEGGRYRLSEHAGYSVEMTADAVEAIAFPAGRVWAG